MLHAMAEDETDPDAGYRDAWCAEIRRRVDLVLSGRSTGLPWPLVMRQIRAQLAERAQHRTRNRDVID
jgi:hypothetical protein